MNEHETGRDDGPRVAEASVGTRLALISYAEPVPTDENFRPMRYGQLAIDAAKWGVETIQIAPSFSHFHAKQRTHSGAETSVDDHRHVLLIDSDGYKRTRSLDRLKFHRQFADGLRRLDLQSLKVSSVILAVPPPTLISIAKGWSSSNEIDGGRIALDIRDPWPDALSPDIQHRFARGLVDGFNKYGAKYALRHAPVSAEVIATCQSHADWFRRATGTGNHIDVLPIGCSDPYESTDPRGRFDRQEVVFVGSLSHQFDFALLLDAWKIIERKNRPNRRLTIIGAGDCEEAVRQQASSLRTVSCLGRMPGLVAKEAMRNATVGIAPYTQGSKLALTNKIFEYVAQGLPLIHNLMNETASLVDQQRLGISLSQHANPEDLALAIERLLSDYETWHAMSRSGSRYALGEGSVTTINERILRKLGFLE